jgi:hypothetical protein
MRNKVKSNKGKIFVMNDISVESAASMARFLVNKEHKGYGDTTEAALYRLSVKYGIKSSVVTRLLYRKTNDMLLSNFAAIASAYQAACLKVEANIEHERTTHEHYSIANSVAGLAIRQKEETE